jgi:hypothetical protein
MSRHKKEIPAPQPQSETDDYERGVTDCLKILREEVYRLSESNREATRLLWNAGPVAQSLLHFVGPAIVLVGDIQNRVENRAIRHLIDRGNKKEAP